MQLTMLGTGSAFAKKYFNNNAMIRVQGYTLLVDCGITAPLALHELGLTPNDLDGILITHLHADHIGGLEEFAFAMKYIYNRKCTLFVPSLLLETLWEHSLKAGMQDQADVTLTHYFEVVSLEADTPVTISDGLKVELIETKHVPQKRSFSLLVNEYLFYSADLTFDLTLLKQLFYDRKCKYILHDCQLHEPPTVHTTLSQLLTTPEDMQKHIYLMHYGDDKEKYICQTGHMKFLEQHKTYVFD